MVYVFFFFFVIYLLLLEVAKSIYTVALYTVKAHFVPKFKYVGCKFFFFPSTAEFSLSVIF